MENDMLVRIANELVDDDLQDEDNIQFCITDELTPADINIKVDGLGVMTFPVNKHYIQKLINISSKTRFGLRDQTILDNDICNSYEIKSDILHITINEGSLTRMLGKMRDILGLGENGVLTPHLHNMLIYGPGQFFDMHQETELEGLVASLVVVLPSPHIGGDSVIEHGKEKHIFSSENIDQSNAKCIGFYADCKHKVEKIKQGYRIALTYNLVLKSDKICYIKNVNQKLTDAVKDYFDIKEGKQTQNEEPKKLVYLLNHSYTEHSLRMSMLKGADQTNALALYGVAQELGLILHLALGEIRESWSDGYHNRFHEFFEDETTLSYWLDSDNEKMPFGECTIDKDEICFTKETIFLEPYDVEYVNNPDRMGNYEPYDEEYEGFTENEHNTRNCWYRRAAIVLWLESNQISMNFRLNYDNALKELRVLTSSLGNEQEAMEIIVKAGRYLHRTLYINEKSDFDMLANIALYIKDKDTALSILSPFKWEILNFDIVKLLVKLQTQYGIRWCIDLLKRWKNHDFDDMHVERYIDMRINSTNRLCLINEIHSFVQIFLYHAGAMSIVELLLDTQSNDLIGSDKECKWKKHAEIKKDLPNRIGKVYQILAACATIEHIPVLDKVTEHLISNPELYPDTSLAELYFKLQDTVPSEYFSNFKLLRSYIVKTIDSNLALGMRSNDDWSIQVALSCTCEHCSVAMSFLRSKTEIKKIWPVKKSICDHITYVFNGSDLPVDLFVERKGSTHKLIMTKNVLLHKDTEKRFDELKFYQQKLQR